MRILLFVTLLSALTATAYGAPVLSSANSDAEPDVPPIRGQAVLYDQNSDDNGIGTVSQNFEAAYAAYVSQGADDFKVPTGSCWDISSIDVTGVYFSGAGPADSVNVTFYKNSGTAPKEDKVIASFANVVPLDNGGSFSITLPSVLKVKPGNYWVSVQANLDFDKGGQWAWETRRTQVRNAAAWKNPAGGFGTACADYGVMTSCFALGQGPDYMFALSGRSKVC